MDQKTCRFKSQKELFKHIWETREHISELTGKPLLSENHPQWHWQFLHVLSKGAYPGYKLREENILLALPEEHQHQEEYDIFHKKYAELRREYYKEFYNKRFNDYD